MVARRKVPTHGLIAPTDRSPLNWGFARAVTMIVAGLALTYLLATFLQSRADEQTVAAESFRESSPGTAWLKVKAATDAGNPGPR